MLKAINICFHVRAIEEASGAMTRLTHPPTPTTPPRPPMFDPNPNIFFLQEHPMACFIHSQYSYTDTSYHGQRLLDQVHT